MRIGEVAALSAALCWTLASLFWGRIRLTALGINLCKNWLGSALLLAQIYATAYVAGSNVTVWSAPARSWFYLGMSGVVGIVIGDTYYFRSLQILGPRRSLMVATTSPLFAVAFGWTFLHEILDPLALAGVGLTMIGVIAVVADRQTKAEAPGIMPGSTQAAIAYGVIGAICQAGGGVLSKLGMTQEVDGEIVSLCGTVEATFIRLVISAVCVVFIVYARREYTAIGTSLKQRSTWRYLVPATMLGTWIGIWFSQVGFRYAPVAIAQTLHSTCPLFAIPLIWFMDGHGTTKKSIFATVVAILGIYLTVR